MTVYTVQLASDVHRYGPYDSIDKARKKAIELIDRYKELNGRVAARENPCHIYKGTGISEAGMVQFVAHGNNAQRNAYYRYYPYYTNGHLKSYYGGGYAIHRDGTRITRTPKKSGWPNVKI